MDCKDYKEAIAADPSGAFDGAEHAAGCADCAAHKDTMQAFDARIAEALAIDVPELTMPVLPPIEADSNVTSLPYRRKTRTSVWLAMAASVALAAFLGVQFLAQDTDYPSLGAEIMAHLDHEPAALKITDREVPERRLAAVLRNDVSQMDTDVGLVSYARTCVINGREIPHLVIQGERGPVTLLLLPDEKVSSAVPLEGEGTQGVILPVGNGSIAIIGERGERLDEVERRLTNSVKWNRT